MTLTTLYIGIDIAKHSFDAVFEQADTLHHCQFCNDVQGFHDLHHWVMTYHYSTDKPHMVMEATGNYWQALATWANAHNLNVSVVNPLHLHAYAKSLGIRTKTDKQDAKLLARYGRHEHPRPWQPKPAHINTLNALLRQLRHHKQSLAKERTRLETACPDTKPHTQNNIRYWQDSIERLELELWQLIDSNDKLTHRASLLATIPGIGKKTIPLLLALIGDGSDFATAKHLVSFVGLAPRHHQSGISIHKTSAIGFSGRKDIRQALFMPAVVVGFGRYPAFQRFVKRLEQQGKHKKQIIIAIMRKLLVIAYNVIKHDRAFDPTCHD